MTARAAELKPLAHFKVPSIPDTKDQTQELKTKEQGQETLITLFPKIVPKEHHIPLISHPSQSLGNKPAPIYANKLPEITKKNKIKTPLIDVTVKLKKEYVQSICNFIDNNKEKLLLTNFKNIIILNCSINYNNLTELNMIEKQAHSQKNNDVLLIIKEAKVNLLKKIEARLNLKLGNETATLQLKEKKFNSIFHKIFDVAKKSVFTSVMFSALIISSFQNYLGINGMLSSIITGISMPVVLTFGILLTIVDSLLFLVFEIKMIQAAMGIDNRNDIKKCLDFDEAETKSIQNIRQLTRQAAMSADESSLNEYNTINKLCNSSIKLKTAYYEKPLKESSLHKCIQTGMTAIGAVIQGAGAFFLMTNLLKSGLFISMGFTASLASGPIGWTIIGIGVLTMLFFYFSMRGDGVMKMFAPEIEQYKNFQTTLNGIDINIEELENYTHKINKINSEICELKRENESISSQLDLQNSESRELSQELPSTSLQPRELFLNQSIELDKKDKITLNNFIRSNNIEIKLQSEIDLICLNKLEDNSFKKDSKIFMLVKEYKVKLIEAMQVKLRKEFPITPENSIEITAPQLKQSKILTVLKSMFAWTRPIIAQAKCFFHWAKPAIVYTTAFLGAGISSISGFLGMQEMLALLAPGFANIGVYALSFFATFAEAFLFLQFEVGFLKQAMGIDNRGTIEKCLDLDKKEYDLMQDIIEISQNKSKELKESQLNELNSVRKIFNTIIENKKNFYKEVKKENPLKAVFRNTMTFVGAGVVALGSFFSMQKIIEYVVMFAGEFYPWIKISLYAVGIFVSLVSFLSMRGKAVQNMFAPEIQKYDNFKKTIDAAKNIPELKNYDLEIKTLEKEKRLLEQRNLFLKDLANKNNIVIKEKVEQLKNSPTARPTMPRSSSWPSLRNAYV